MVLLDARQVPDWCPDSAVSHLGGSIMSIVTHSAETCKRVIHMTEVAGMISGPCNPRHTCLAQLRRWQVPTGGGVAGSSDTARAEGCGGRVRDGWDWMDACQREQSIQMARIMHHSDVSCEHT